MLHVYMYYGQDRNNPSLYLHTSENMCCADVSVHVDSYVLLKIHYFRDHFFDTKERIRVHGRKKEECVSKERNAVQRGSLGVRWEKSRRNDSKLLPTTRMGLDTE